MKQNQEKDRLPCRVCKSQLLELYGQVGMDGEVVGIDTSPRHYKNAQKFYRCQCGYVEIQKYDTIGHPLTSDTFTVGVPELSYVSESSTTICEDQ